MNVIWRKNRGKLVEKIWLGHLRRGWRFLLLTINSKRLKSRHSSFLSFSLSLSKFSENLFVRFRSKEHFSSPSLLPRISSENLRNGDGVPSRQIQAGVLGRSIRRQNQHHHPLHVRQIRHHVSGPPISPPISILLFFFASNSRLWCLFSVFNAVIEFLAML